MTGRIYDDNCDGNEKSNTKEPQYNNVHRKNTLELVNFVQKHKTILPSQSNRL